MKNVLVTGAGGFIGSHLVARLIRNGYKVRAFVRYNSRNNWGWLESLDCKNNLEVVSGDVRDPETVKLATKGMDTIFHLAALIGIPYSYVSPSAYVATNINGTLNILHSALSSDVKKIVITSTSEIYGTVKKGMISEACPINPQSPYAASKAGADFIALSFYRSFGLPVTIVRPFNTYGPRQSARAIIPTIITQILSGRKEVKLGSLTPVRDLTFVDDITEGFMLAGGNSSTEGETINLGSNIGISIGKLSGVILKIMKSKAKIRFETSRKRPDNSEVGRLVADTGKARRFLGWSPRYSLEEGLRRTISWFKDNKGLYKGEIYNI